MFSATDVSIRYNLNLEDGTLLSSNHVGDPFSYTPGQGEILPLLEAALQGLTRGDRRRIVLSPELDPAFGLEVSRLALLFGQSGKTLILSVEVL